CGGPTLYVSSMTNCFSSGLDFSRVAIRYCREKALSLGMHDRSQFVCANATAIPFTSNSFDLVMSFGAFVNIAQRKHLLQECFRVLKPNGIIAFCDQVSFEGLGEEDSIPASIFKALETFAPHYLLTISTYTQLLKEAGFEIIKIENRTETMKQVNRAWLNAMLETWQDLVAEHMVARFLMERNYLETLDNLADKELAGEAFFMGLKPERNHAIPTDSDEYI